MKQINKEIKLVTLGVILTLIFLFSFNVVYSYFMSAKSLDADLDFYRLKVNMAYKETVDSSFVTISDVKQLYPTKSV